MVGASFLLLMVVMMMLVMSFIKQLLDSFILSCGLMIF